MAGLEVQIGADNSDLKKKIQEAELALKELSQVKLEQIKLGLDTKEINGNIASVKKSLNELKTVSKDTGNAVAGMAPKTVNASNALTQFSRIAQDAPYGIQGIGNNITATVEAFGYLKTATGSTGGALKALAGSLLGSGGILLAVSLVTSGLTYMSQQGLTVGDVFNKLTGDFDANRKAMQDLNAEAVKGSSGQIASMNAYVATASNVNLSMNDRLIAVKKLQEEYPAYFGNLTKEQILNGNVGAAVREVTSALIAKAKAAALTDRIVKLAEEEEKIQSQINNSIAAQFKQYRLTKQEAFDAATVLNKQLRGQIDLVGELNAGRANDLSKAEKTALAAYQYSQTLKDLGVDLRANLKDQDKLTNGLNNQYAAFIKLETAKPKAAKKEKPTFDTPQVAGLDVSITKTGLDGLVSLSGMLANVSKNVVGAEGVISTSLKRIPSYFKAMSVESMAALIKFNESANGLIKGAIADTFASFGEAIGGALGGANNVLNNLGDTLLGIFGTLLASFGKLLIQLGTGLVIADLALKSGNGYAAIAAGIALVAVGSAFTKGRKNLSASSASGATSGGSGGNSYSSPASSNSYGGGQVSSGNGKVVFEISGRSLIGVLSNEADYSLKLGGNLGL